MKSKQFGDHKSTKNAYVLFAEVDSVAQAAQKNGFVLNGTTL